MPTLTNLAADNSNAAGVPPAPPGLTKEQDLTITLDDVAALQAMLKSPAPTIRAAARRLLVELGVSDSSCKFMQ